MKKYLALFMCFIIALSFIQITASAETTTQAFNRRVNELIGKVSVDKMTDFEKTVYAYNAIRNNGTYSDSFSFCAHKEGPIVYGLGNCEGWLEAYSYLLDKLKVPNVKLKIYELNHGWNAVRIEGKWYHCDLTIGAFLIGDSYYYEARKGMNFYYKNKKIEFSKKDYTEGEEGKFLYYNQAPYSSGILDGKLYTIESRKMTDEEVKKYGELPYSCGFNYKGHSNHTISYVSRIVTVEGNKKTPITTYESALKKKLFFASQDNENIINYIKKDCSRGHYYNDQSGTPIICDNYMYVGTTRINLKNGNIKRSEIKTNFHEHSENNVEYFDSTYSVGAMFNVTCDKCIAIRGAGSKNKYKKIQIKPTFVVQQFNSDKKTHIIANNEMKDEICDYDIFNPSPKESSGGIQVAYKLAGQSKWKKKIKFSKSEEIKFILSLTKNKKYQIKTRYAVSGMRIIDDTYTNGMTVYYGPWSKVKTIKVS